MLTFRLHLQFFHKISMCLIYLTATPTLCANSYVHACSGHSTDVISTACVAANKSVSAVL